MEINKLENEETVDRINKTSILFFKKINKIDKSLSILTKKKKGKIQIIKIRNECGIITTNSTKIIQSIRILGIILCQQIG